MRRYSNYGSTTLADNSLTSIVGIHPATHEVAVVNGAGELSNFPTLTGDDYAYVTVEDVTGNFEIMRLVSVNPGVPSVTVTRSGGAFPAGSPDVPDTLYTFPSGSRIEIRATAGSFEDVLQRDGDTIHGGVFGTAPTAPASGTQTILVKHSTDTVDALLADVSTGELAYNAKLNVLYAGGVDGSEAPELKTIIAGMYIGPTAPVAPYVITGKLWFDTTPTVMALKVYSGGAWTVVLGTAGLASLILANNVALKAYIAAGGSTYDLIKLNATNELEIGQSTLLTLIKILATNIEVGPLKLMSPGGVVGYYFLRTIDFSGDTLGVLEPVNANGVGAGFGLNVKSDADVVRTFAFDKDGFLTLPVQTPTLAGHAASKAYVDAAVGGGAAAFNALASGKVAANGTIVGTAFNVSGVVKDNTGRYTITLTNGAASVNNLNVVASPYFTRTNATNWSFGVSCNATSASTFTVDVYRNGNDPLYYDQGFSFIAFGGE